MDKELDEASLEVGDRREVLNDEHVDRFPRVRDSAHAAPSRSTQRVLLGSNRDPVGPAQQEPKSYSMWDAHYPWQAGRIECPRPGGLRNGSTQEDIVDRVNARSIAGCLPDSRDCAWPEEPSLARACRLTRL